MPTWSHRSLDTAGLGVAVGLLSGLFGVGGGVLAVPAMVGILGISQHRAHGTSLAVVIVTAAVAGAIYATRGHIDWGLALALLVGTVVGVNVGARLIARISAERLQRLFAVVLLLTGIRLVIG